MDAQKKTLLIRCRDKAHKTNHLRLVDKLRSQDKISYADTTSVNFAGKYYCIAVDVDTRRSDVLQNMIQKIRNEHKITDVIEFGSS